MRQLGAGLLVFTVMAAGCGGGDEKATPGQMASGAGDGGGSTTTLTGAGATFPYPIYSKWFDAYGKAHSVRVNYQPIGSGGGIQQLTQGTVDFGGSDAPMNAEESAKAPNTLHLPTVIGAVAVTYNLPGVSQPVKLSGPLLADIFAGRVKKWDDARLQQLNAGVQLPASDILVVHRSDGSGTSFVFTEYLSAASPSWKSSVGSGKSVKWPTGLGAKGNEGVAGQVKQTQGAIGYVEQVYAQQNQLPMAAIQNAGGQFVQPSLAATAAAAEQAASSLPADTDFKISLIDKPGAQTYPITSWTYLLVPSHFQDCAKARALADLSKWSYSAEADSMASALGYSPVPTVVEQAVLKKWGTVTCGPNNQPLSQG